MITTIIAMVIDVLLVFSLWLMYKRRPQEALYWLILAFGIYALSK